MTFFRSSARLAGAVGVLAAALVATIGPDTAAAAPKPLKGPLGITVRVTNQSRTCAWVTVYYARVYTPWTIASDPHNRPRFVHPNAFYDFGVVIPDVLPKSPAEIKVRTEVARNANCSGGTVRDLSAENKAIYGDQGAGHLKTVRSTLSGDVQHGLHLSKPE